MPRVKRSMPGFDLARALDGAAIDPGRAIGPQVYDHLRARIIDTRLPPGAPIHEKDISDLCGISRTPVRAALQQLSAEGLVETRPQVGSIVAPLNRGRFLEAVFIRVALEGAVVRRLAGRGLDEARLGPLLERQRAAAAADDYAAFFGLDEAFHALLAEMAGTPTAWALVQQVKAHVDRERLGLMGSIPGRSAEALADHEELLAAIRRGDGNAAAAVMGRHIETVLDVLHPSPTTLEESRRNGL
jgi:DNA-binding GntR family transcriptional regulator